MRNNPIILTTGLNPNKNKKKERITIYLTKEQKEWVKKLAALNKCKTQSSFFSALLDREIEFYKGKK